MEMLFQLHEMVLPSAMSNLTMKYSDKYILPFTRKKDVLDNTKTIGVDVQVFSKGMDSL